MSRHRRLTRASLVLLSLAIAAPDAFAQVPRAQQLGVFVYPAKNQPKQQQQAEGDHRRDRWEMVQQQVDVCEVR